MDGQIIGLRKKGDIKKAKSAERELERLKQDFRDKYISLIQNRENAEIAEILYIDGISEANIADITHYAQSTISRRIRIALSDIAAKLDAETERREA
ncbi:MAG: hypothetical protein LBC74_12735, partial [Planctomycetaceae bacterium]|jgi:DNA-directed RNA polymerase specialized sigma24 family protein|nr:hypothetical protein [Planctomycetaceae bacterium]